MRLKDVIKCALGSFRCRIAGVSSGKHVLLGPDNYIASVDHCFHEIEVPIMYQGAYEPIEMAAITCLSETDLGYAVTAQLSETCILANTWLLEQTPLLRETSRTFRLRWAALRVLSSDMIS